MEIKVDENIFSKYGDIKVGVVKVSDFNISDAFLELAKVKTQEAIKKFKKMIGEKELEEFECVKIWKNIYAKMGCSSSRVSSIENLYSIIKEKNNLPNINPIVNYYNAISCISEIPMGAYDITKIVGDLTLREATKGEKFVPMCLNQVEKTKNDEVIYADNEKVTCRYWNNKDSDKTKIDNNTNQVVFFFDVLPEISKEFLEETINNVIKDFKQTNVSNDIIFGILENSAKCIEL